jgi:hypothetical protein
MTADASDQAAQVDGQPPPPGQEEPPEDYATPIDRFMGIILIGLCGLGVLIGLDLITGGRLSRAAGLGAGES